MEIIYNQIVLGKKFKIYGTNEKPLFLAKDVAEWIDYSVSNVSKMLKSVDDDEKTTRKISTNGLYQTDAWFLTEDGLVAEFEFDYLVRNGLSTERTVDELIRSGKIKF